MAPYTMLNERFAAWLRHWPSGTGTGITPDMSVVLATDLGLKRSQNQDRVAALRVGSGRDQSPFLVVALADGMGGMADGLECAIQTIANFFEAILRLKSYAPEEMLRLAALESNRAVYKFARSNGGATLSAVMLGKFGAIHTLNVGDSRIYGRAMSSPENAVVRLTVDDNLEEAVGGVGKELLQFVGMGPGMMPHVDRCSSAVDRLLITSDGVHFIDEAVLSEIVNNTELAVDASKQLLTFARWRGSPDNASLAVIDVAHAVESLHELDAEVISASDPYGTFDVIWTTPRRNVAHNVTPTDRESDNKPDVFAAPIKRQRRLRAPPQKKSAENDSEQLSIEIDSGPETNERDEGRK